MGTSAFNGGWPASRTCGENTVDMRHNGTSAGRTWAQTTPCTARKAVARIPFLQESVYARCAAHGAPVRGRPCDHPAHSPARRRRRPSGIPPGETDPESRSTSEAGVASDELPAEGNVELPRGCCPGRCCPGLAAIHRWKVLGRRAVKSSVSRCPLRPFRVNGHQLPRRRRPLGPGGEWRPSRFRASVQPRAP